MRTRNAGTPKSAAGKKTPPARKSAAKTPPSPATESVIESATPKTVEAKTSPSPATESVIESATPKTVEAKTPPSPATESVIESATPKTVVAKTPPSRATGSVTESATPKTVEANSASASKTKHVRTDQTTSNPSADSKPEQPAEQAEAASVVVVVSPVTKVAKTTKTVLKKTTARTKTPTSAKGVSKHRPKLEETDELKVQESTEKEEVEYAKDVNAKNEDISISNVEEPGEKEEHAVENEETKKVEDQNAMNVEEPAKEEEKAIDAEEPLFPAIGKSTKQENSVVEPSEDQEPGTEGGGEEVKEEMEEMTKTIEDEVEPKTELVNMEEDFNRKLKAEDTQPGDEFDGEERTKECRDLEVLEDFGKEALAEDDIAEHGEEAETLEREQMELTVSVKERKIRKELEVFVGGLDRDAVEEDVKKAFEKIGEVVEVRLNKNTSTNKNKGYAFVKFGTKEQVSRALSEMKNPLIRGKRCRTAPSEDNDTLFLGNICNTWTNQAIKQKLNDYGIEGVEHVTLVPDAQQEGLSRGFAFIEFSCHADAMLAYKRLQEPDVIFGHPERTAKVAFAEPLREPDPDVMAQVKSVFFDGLPPHWDEDQVREQLKSYGEIVRIRLARNMSTAKRKDFGFVDFSAHDAAVACVEGINNTNFGDGNSKTKVRARLSNPLPKTQAVKGGMCGGFRIAHGGAGSFTNFGRGFRRGGRAFNRTNFQHGRGFYPRGHGQNWRRGHEQDLDIQYSSHQREMFGRGGWRDSFGAARDAFGGPAVPPRSNLDGFRHIATDRGRGRHIPARSQPFPPEEGFNRPFVGRSFDDPYLYDESAQGIKRPFSVIDQDLDYMEPSRFRPRLNYFDPSVPFHGPCYRDSFEAGSGLYPQDYYGFDYGEGSYSSFYGIDRPYGGHYYY
ncbi:hypothetical protein U1Q18_011569 [Sarracenia purpurea var. burkii]